MSGQSHLEKADGAIAPPTEEEFSASRFRLALLGPFLLTASEGQEIVIGSKKNRLLLAMLAISPTKSLSREVLAGALWGDHSDDQAKNSLRQALAVLRKELAGREHEVFSSLDTMISLNPQRIEIDADEFKRDAEGPDAERLRRAIGLWRGLFLADINAGEEYLDGWLAEQREAFSAMYIRALDCLVPLAGGHERIELAQRLVNFDNLREASHRRLMEAYQSQGERALALRHYEKIKKLLRDEIGVEPSPETQELRDKIAASDPKRGALTRSREWPIAETPTSVEPEHQVTISMSRPTRRRWIGMAAVAILAVAIAGTLWFQRDQRPTAVIEPSVAVLPFENLSGDPANGRMADGLTEDVITDLSRFRDFTVIARESTEVYKGKPVDVRQIGKDLNVSYVLEGSFQRDEDQVRITAQLIETATGTHVWSERYDRPANEVFAVQSEVADRIASSLGGHGGIVAGNDLIAAKRKLPSDLGAYELYLLAREKSKVEITDEAQIEAQKLLDRAIQIDPAFARAYVMYAWTYSWRHTYEAGAPELVQQMLKMARRGIELDPMDADAHQALGYALTLSGDLKQGDAQLDEALRLNPNSFDINAVYGCMGHAYGKAEAGAKRADWAMRLNPTIPAWAIPCLRLAMVMVGRYKDVVEIQSRQAEDDWNTDGFVITAGSLAELGRIEEAKALATRGVAKFPGLLSIEKFALNRNWPPSASKVMADLMRKAGFPACASVSELADTPNPVRLPECNASSASGQHAALSIPAIAVLSFDNLAGDEANGRIADGITDDIITELSRFRDLDVIDRNSTEVYKGKPIDVRQIGRDLNVGYVLEGSFQRQGDHIRINMQLIDTSTGHQIFSERFDNPSQNLFAVQAEVAAKVANSLGGVDGLVSITDLLAAKRKQETDLNAYALYLLGDEARRELTEESQLRAEKILKQAIAADPMLARAHTSLANTYSRLMLFQTDMGPSTKLMLEESRHAVELDPLDARAHAALAYATGMTGDLKQAEVEYDKALGLSPNAFDVLKSYACWAFAFGKGEAGAQAVDRALRLNPRYPDHGVDCFRYALFMVGRYEDAVRTQRRLPEQKWNPDGFAMTAGSLAALGQVDEAKALAARGFAKFPSVLSVEKFALDRGWSPPESAKLLDLMQKAGFPICAAKADLADNPNLVRLPGCTADVMNNLAVPQRRPH
jgi:TolB-like protein/DNA-binding SARP family transcriptional activator/Tfp pilus assembly protein PilF